MSKRAVMGIVLIITLVLFGCISLSTQLAEMRAELVNLRSTQLDMQTTSVQSRTAARQSQSPAAVVGPSRSGVRWAVTNNCGPETPECVGQVNHGCGPRHNGTACGQGLVCNGQWCHEGCEDTPVRSGNDIERVEGMCDYLPCEISWLFDDCSPEPSGPCREVATPRIIAPINIEYHNTGQQELPPANEEYQDRISFLQKCQNESTLAKDPTPFHRPQIHTPMRYTTPSRDGFLWDTSNCSLCTPPRQTNSINQPNSASQDKGKQSETMPAALAAAVPYVFVVPTLSDECPEWFKANLVNALQAQQTGIQALPPNDPIQPVVLIEEEPGKCRDFSIEVGVWHVTISRNQTKQYWDLFPVNGSEDASTNLWGQSIIRHFILNEWLQQTPQIEMVIYLDWDTTVYIDSGTAASILSVSGVEMATCFDAPLSTSNNVFVFYTRASLEDFIRVLAIQSLIVIPAECPGISKDNDMQMIRLYYLYQYRDHLDEDILLNSPEDWLRHTRRIDPATVESRPCSNRNVNCNPLDRWDRPPPAPHGSHQPPWHFGPPQYDVFNLCEPFGEGNVVAEYLFDNERRFGSYGSNTPELYEHRNGAKLVTFLDANCDPYLSQKQPPLGYPTWGWHNFAPESPTFGIHFFRVWATHFAVDSKLYELSFYTKSEMKAHFRQHGSCLPSDKNGRDLRSTWDPNSVLQLYV